MNNHLQIETLLLGPLNTNCYILSDGETRSAVVIDPADDGQLIYNHLTKNNLILVKILLTHGHYDHIGGIVSLKSLSNAPIFIHSLDAEMLTNPEKNFSVFIGTPYKSPEPDGFLNDGELITVGKKQVRVFHTPGHSQGSVSFACDGFVIVGDTLFNGSVGRTDFPGSSFDILIQSIQSKLLTLPDDTIAYPGHGPETTIGKERKGNPFFV